MSALSTAVRKSAAMWAWVPLCLWYGGFAGGTAGAIGSALGWLGGSVGGVLVAGHPAFARPVRRWVPLAGVLATAPLAFLVAFPVARIAAGFLCAFHPESVPWCTLLSHGMVVASGFAFCLAAWARHRLLPGLILEAALGALLALVPLAAHRNGGLPYPYWLADGAAARGWDLHTGYFAAGLLFVLCLVLRLAPGVSPRAPGSRQGWRSGTAAVTVLVLLWLPLAFGLFPVVRLPLGAATPPSPPPPDSDPEANEQDQPPPPQPPEPTYEALVRFQSLPPESPREWKGHLFRLQAEASGAPSAQGTSLASDVFVFSGPDPEGPPVLPEATRIEPFRPPPGCRAAFHTVSLLPARGFDPELLFLYRPDETGVIRRIEPEPLPESWHWIREALDGEPGFGTRSPVERIGTTVKWLRRNTFAEPPAARQGGSPRNLEQRIQARKVPIHGSVDEIIGLAVRLLRADGIPARVGRGYRYPFAQTGDVSSDFLLYDWMRTSWLEVGMGSPGWTPLVFPLEGEPAPQANQVDSETLQQVLELLRREQSVPGGLFPGSQALRTWFPAALLLALVLWRTLGLWRFLWLEPMRASSVPAATPAARALQLLSGLTILDRSPGEPLEVFAKRLGAAHPRLGALLSRVLSELESDYRRLTGDRPPDPPSLRLRSTYAAFLASLALIRPLAVAGLFLHLPRIRRQPVVFTPP